MTTPEKLQELYEIQRHDGLPFMDDGVEYRAVDCVNCHGTVVVATAALIVADRKSWPLCSECWSLIDKGRAMSEPLDPQPPPEPREADPLPARCPHCFLLVRRMTYEDWFCPEHGIVRPWYGNPREENHD